MLDKEQSSMDTLLRAVLSADPGTVAPPGFTSRVMAHISEMPGRSRESFVRVAWRLMLAGGCLTGALGSVMAYGLRQMDTAVMIRVLGGGFGLNYLF